jgi:YVTN family beta-propeller protein
MEETTKMTNKQAFRGGLAILAGMALCTVFISPAAAQQSKLRIIQTNSAGDNVHIIDAATNKVVGEIKGIEAPHGITVAPDGSRIYISENLYKLDKRFYHRDDDSYQKKLYGRFTA